MYWKSQCLLKLIQRPERWLQHNYACTYISRRFKRAARYFFFFLFFFCWKMKRFCPLEKRQERREEQINGKKRRAKDTRCENRHLAAEVGVCIPTGSEIPKGFAPASPPVSSAHADGDCKRTRWKRNAPLTSDAPNAIRTTLRRNISQIGVECLAVGAILLASRGRCGSRFTRAYVCIFLNKKSKVVRRWRRMEKEKERERTTSFLTESNSLILSNKKKRTRGKDRQCHRRDDFLKRSICSVRDNGGGIIIGEVVSIIHRLCARIHS